MVKLWQLKALVSIMAVIASPYQPDGKLHYLITIYCLISILLFNIFYFIILLFCLKLVYINLLYI